MSSKRRALTLSIGLTAVVYLAGVLLADRHAVLAAFGRLHPATVLGIFLLSLLNYLLRFWRWHCYIAVLGHRLPRWRHLLYYLAGFTLTVTPGKAGEAVRSLYLFPCGVPYSQSLAALLVERLLDVLAMGLLALLILLVRPDYAWPVIGAWGLALGLIGLVTRPGLPERLQAWRRGHRFSHHVGRLGRLFGATAVLLRPGLLLFGLALGVLGWGLEGLAVYWSAREMGVPVTLAAAIGVYAIAVLAGALSFLPGGLGGTEMVMGGLLIAFGADGATAVAITLLCRLATLWFAVALGGVAVAVLGLSGQAPPETERPVVPVD
ncbi:MAG TPA: lysylphosphatidylglycerol synthase transmembrane domain-containing protein [Candidatus Competibacter sp.]|nr:TIGR00374 family protein [Candidatus Competibacteraceae bacterium]HRC72318.1 lysylphosphatidylglycerol synthase transmembrane domain-containing protein [Candidatus Competibacter sp.]